MYIIIIIKISSTGTSGKNKVVYKSLSKPHKHLRYRKLKKTQLREATNGWLHLWTHPAFRCQTQCREGHPTSEHGPVGNTLQIWDVRHLDTSYNNRWAAAAALFDAVALLRTPTLVEADISSLNIQWFEFELINLVQHTQPSNTKSMKQRQETMIVAKPGQRIHQALEELKVTFRIWHPHCRTILKDWENKCLITTK